jgi:hypothetical protein
VPENPQAPAPRRSHAQGWKKKGPAALECGRAFQTPAAPPPQQAEKSRVVAVILNPPVSGLKMSLNPPDAT